MATLNTSPPTLPIIRSYAPDDDYTPNEHAELTTQQEKFALAWAITGNRTQAYRDVYTVSPRTIPEVVRKGAHRLASMPKVYAKYREIMDNSTLDVIRALRELYRIQLEIMTADPEELVRVVLRCCRFCHGHLHHYQWESEDEYMAAAIKAIDEKTDPPSDVGGYGFVGSFEPSPICPKCYGAGIPQTVITPTSQLTGSARRLYAGAEQDRFGVVKVKMHDQQRAAELIARMSGLFGEGELMKFQTPEQRAAARAQRTLPDNITAESAGKAYLQLMD